MINRGDRSASILVGLDLGQARDHSALAVIELFHGDPDSERDPRGELLDKRPFYICRGIDRLPLGTPYADVAARTEGLLAELHTRHPRTRLLLILDATGLGQPVREFFVRAGSFYRLIPTTITSGTKYTSDDGVASLGKGVMVGSLMAALGTRRLLLPGGDMGKQMEQELHTYQRSLVKRASNALTEMFGAPARTGVHDDEVTALGLVVSYPPPPPPPSAAALAAFRNARFYPQLEGITHAGLRDSRESHGVRFDADGRVESWW